MTSSAESIAPCLCLIEDEEPIRRFLRASLGALGYRLMEAATAREGLALAAGSAPDLILLDLGLPDQDGLEVLARIREFSTVPVIILSARGNERDKIAGLDAGADDYLTKPFGAGELAARIRTALRHAARSRQGPPDGIVHSGDLTIDLDARTAVRNSRPIHLTPNEYKILALLARHAGLVVTQAQIIREIWGHDRPGLSHHLRVYMHQLRHKIEPEPANPRHLLTEPWVGYRLWCGD